MECINKWNSKSLSFSHTYRVNKKCYRSVILSTQDVSSLSSRQIPYLVPSPLSSLYGPPSFAHALLCLGRQPAAPPAQRFLARQAITEHLLRASVGALGIQRRARPGPSSARNSAPSQRPREAELARGTLGAAVAVPGELGRAASLFPTERWNAQASSPCRQALSRLLCGLGVGGGVSWEVHTRSEASCAPPGPGHSALRLSG